MDAIRGDSSCADEGGPVDSFDDTQMEQDEHRHTRGRRRGQRTAQLATLAATVMFALAITSKVVGG